MTPDSFAEVIAVLEGAYRVRFTPNQTRVWEGFLSSVDGRTGKRAAEEAVRRLDRLPSIAQFLALAGEVREGVEQVASLGRPALPSGAEETVSLAPAEQMALLARLNARIVEMRAAGVPRDSRQRLLVAEATDAVNDARARRGRPPLLTSDGKAM